MAVKRMNREEFFGALEPFDAEGLKKVLEVAAERSETTMHQGSVV